MIQVRAISPALSQCTYFGLSEAPIPMMVVETTWVVETGAPSIEAPKITAADASCESRAWSGRTR
jgi:hypothetical protein